MDVDDAQNTTCGVNVFAAGYGAPDKRAFLQQHRLLGSSSTAVQAERANNMDESILLRLMMVDNEGRLLLVGVAVSACFTSACRQVDLFHRNGINSCPSKRRNMCARIARDCCCCRCICW